jgi:carbon storage regulator
MMLMCRKVGECLRIGDQVMISVLAIRGHKVQLCIKAPASINIWREEFFEPEKRRHQDDRVVEICTWIGEDGEVI